MHCIYKYVQGKMKQITFDKSLKKLDSLLLENIKCQYTEAGKEGQENHPVDPFIQFVDVKIVEKSIAGLVAFR